MPYRNTPLVNDEYYHVYNRGVAKQIIFRQPSDYKRFIEVMHFYRIDAPSIKFSDKPKDSNLIRVGRKLVNIVCYCYMPNHFHLLLQQLSDNGISKFISNISNSYTRYFNTKYHRVGPLFQGRFKTVHIESNEQLIHLSRYIHLNPLVGHKVTSLTDYQWSSYNEYIAKTAKKLCEKKIILSQFNTADSYQNFIQNHIEYAQKLEVIKHQLIDEYPEV